MKTITIKSKQAGLGYLGMLVVGIMLACSGVVLAQVFPTLLEFQAVSKAVHKASLVDSEDEARRVFERAAAIDDIHSIQAKDLDIRKLSGKLKIEFAYEREIHLAGPAWLTLKYEGQSK